MAGRMRRLAAVAALVAAVGGTLGAGCSRAERAIAEPGAGELTIPGRFSLLAGAGARLLPVTAIDSGVGKIQFGGTTIEFDHGPYSDPFERMDSDESYQARDVVLDGRKARVVTLRSATRFAGRPYFIGVHFPDLGSTSLGKIRLSLYAATASAQERAQAERVMLTVKLR